jgi:redox-sensitive bicupin YhaK (pirin superfamily)
VYQGDETSVNSETGATGGAAVVSGKRVEAGQAAWFEDLRGSSVTEQTEVTIEPAAGATKAARVFVFHGLPIGEPVVSHGPFVMNTQAEIAQAFADYRAGKF